MASTTTAAPTAPGSGRLRQISLTQRVLARPAAGALIIVIFVWVVFLVLSLARGNTAFLSLAGTLNYLDVAAQIGVIVSVLVITLALMLVTQPVMRVIGVTGGAVLGRLLGVLLAALASQFVMDGIRGAMS